MLHASEDFYLLTCRAGRRLWKKPLLEKRLAGDFPEPMLDMLEDLHGGQEMARPMHVMIPAGALETTSRERRRPARTGQPTEQFSPARPKTSLLPIKHAGANDGGHAEDKEGGCKCNNINVLQ